MTDAVLFLCQRIPYPPNKGCKIRAFHMLRHLSRRYRVHLGSFVDDPVDWDHARTLREQVAGLHLSRLDKRDATLRSSKGLVRHQALSLPYYDCASMRAWVDNVLTEVRPQAVFCFSSAMAQYVLDHPRRPRRFVMDFVDVDSDKWRQYAETRKPPMRWVYAREAERLLAWERRVAEAADASLFVSEPEAELFRSLAPESARHVHAIPNGVDFAFFDPDLPHKRPFAETQAPAIVFTGAMDYWPNVEAATWFAETVLPRVREFHPTATFFVVGSNPAPEVQALAARDGVVVTGRVPDVRPYLAHADAVVAPIGIARGIQNKVLEGMAMGTVVVPTPQALEGIPAMPGRDVLLADREPERYARAVMRALEKGRDGPMAEAARRFVVEHFSWDAKLSALDPLIAPPVPMAAE